MDKKNILAHEINKEIQAIQKDIKEALIEGIPIDKIKKPKEFLSKVDEEAQLCVGAFHEDILRGFECYLKQALPSELPLLDQLNKKIGHFLQAIVTNDIPFLLTKEDFDFLESIALRAFENTQYIEASCMWRFIIYLEVASPKAWVGWALSEQLLNHLNISEQIYRMGLSLFPFDVYFVSFAADFLVLMGQKQEAKEALTLALEFLNKEQEISEDAIEILSQQLKAVA